MDDFRDEPMIRLPAAALVALADGCARLGDPAAETLREAGRITGLRLFDLLTEDEPAEELPADAFWTRVNEVLDASGLGEVEYRVHEGGVAELSTARGPEAGERGARARVTSGCHFTTGMLGGILSRAAGKPIAILEVECRADSASACRFLVGSEERLSAVHARLSGGASLEEALAARGAS